MRKDKSANKHFVRGANSFSVFLENTGCQGIGSLDESTVPRWMAGSLLIDGSID